MDVSTTAIDALFQTAERFRDIGQHRRALAALQRVFAHPDGTDADRERAVGAMKRINASIIPPGEETDSGIIRKRRRRREQAAERNRQRDRLNAIRARLGLAATTFCGEKRPDQLAEQHRAFVRVAHAYRREGLTVEQIAAFLKRTPTTIAAALEKSPESI